MKNIFYILCLFVLTFSWKTYACEGEKNRIRATDIPSFTVMKRKSKKGNYHGVLFDPAIGDTDRDKIEFVYNPKSKCWASSYYSRGSVCNYSPEEFEQKPLPKTTTSYRVESSKVKDEDLFYTAVIVFNHESGEMYAYPTREGTKEVDTSKPYYKIQSVRDENNDETLIITHQRQNCTELGRYTSTLNRDFKSKADKTNDVGKSCPEQISGNDISVRNCQDCQSKEFNSASSTPAVTNSVR